MPSAAPGAAAGPVHDLTWLPGPSASSGASLASRESPFSAEDLKIRDALLRDKIGARMRLAVHQLASKEALSTAEFCRRLFFSLNPTFCGFISLSLFSSHVLPRLKGAFQQFTVTPQDEESMIRLLDYDGLGKIMWGEFLNYFSLEEEGVQVIFIKLRVEMKLFLMNRENYAFFRAYQELSLFSSYSPLTMETFEYLLVRKLGVSSLTREQLLLLFNHLREGQETIPFTVFLAFLQSQTSDILGDDKPCIVDLRFSSSSRQEASLSSQGFTLVRKDGQVLATDLEHVRTFRNVRKKLWVLARPCHFYPSRAEFLKQRITDIDLSRNDKNAMLIEKNFYPLKHGGKSVRSPNEVYIYAKRDPMSEYPLIEVELQEKPEWTEHLKKLDYAPVGSEALGLSLLGATVSLFALKYRIDLEISQIMRAIIPTDVMIRLSRSLLDLLRATMIQRQLRYAPSIAPFASEGRLSMTGFCEFVQSFHLRKEDRESKLVFNTIKNRSVATIAVEDFRKLICWTPEYAEKSLNNFADHMYNHPEEYRTLIACIDEADADGSGLLPLDVFHGLLTKNKCAILIEELEEWFRKTTLVEKEQVEYAEFFRMWWNDEVAFRQENRALFIRNQNEEGFLLDDVSGLQGVNQAIAKMRRVWREHALELGGGRYLELEKTFLEIGVASLEDVVPLSLLKTLPRRPPFNLNVRAMDLKMLLIRLTGGRGDRFTFPVFIDFLLLGEDGLESVVRRMQEAVRFSHREFQMNVSDLFFHLDEDADGLLSREEIQTGYKQLSQGHTELTPMEMALFMTKYDVHREDRVSLAEFDAVVILGGLRVESLSVVAPSGGVGALRDYDIEEDDLAFDGSLVVHVSKASGVLLRGYGSFRPYVRVQFLSYTDPIYVGQTKPSKSVVELENRYSILWEEWEDAFVSVRYPGEDLQHPLELQLSLYDVDRFQDILIGRCALKGRALQQRLYRRGEEAELELHDDSASTVGHLSVSFAFVPSRFEESRKALVKPRSDSLLDHPGNLFVTVQKAKGVNALSAKVQCTLLPENTVFSTSPSEQPVPRSVIVFSREHGSTLKIPFLSSDRALCSLRVDTIQPRRVLEDIVLGTRVVGAAQLSVYIENSMTVWIPLLDAQGAISCRVQATFQFILLEEDAVHPLMDVLGEIEGVPPRSLGDLREHLRGRLPANASEELFLSLRSGDPSHSQVLSYAYVFATLANCSVPSTPELKSTIIHLFDTQRTGSIQYYQLCGRALSNEYLQRVLDRLKALMIGEYNRGKDFRRAFASIGFEDAIPLDPFLTVVRTTVGEQDLSVDYLSLLFYSFTRESADSIHYDDFFGFLEDAEQNAQAAVRVVEARLSELLRRNESIQRALQVFYRFDYAGAGFVSLSSLTCALCELGVQVPAKSLQLFFDKHGNGGAFYYESVLQLLVPELFGGPRSALEATMAKLRQWASSERYHYLALMERLRSVASGDVSCGLSRRSFRVFLSSLGAPMDDAEWKPLLEAYSSVEHFANVDVDHFFRELCSQRAESEEERADRELRQHIRKAVGSKGLTFNFAERFRQYDRELTRRVSLSDFRSVLDVEKIPLSEPELARLLKRLDPRASGSLAYHDFLDFFSLSHDELEELNALVRAAVGRFTGVPLDLFRRFDLQRNNTIRVVDFKACLQRMEVVLSEFDFNSLVQQFSVPKSPFRVFYVAFLSQFYAEPLPLLAGPDGAVAEWSLPDEESIAPAQVPRGSRLGAHLGVGSLRSRTAAPYRSAAGRAPIFGLPQKVVDDLKRKEEASAAMAHAWPGTSDLQFEERALAFKSSGLFTCPVCEFQQTRKFLHYCDICGASNPYAFVPSNLVPCPSCCYRNPPTRRCCELCKEVLSSEVAPSPRKERASGPSPRKESPGDARASPSRRGSQDGRLSSPIQGTVTELTPSSGRRGGLGK